LASHLPVTMHDKEGHTPLLDFSVSLVHQSISCQIVAALTKSKPRAGLGSAFDQSDMEIIVLQNA